MVTGFQFLALACSGEYSWQTHRLSTFADVKDVGGPQSISVSANAPRPARQQGTNLLHPRPIHPVELTNILTKAKETTYSIDWIPNDDLASNQIQRIPHSTRHNRETFDTPLDEQSRLPKDRRIIQRPNNFTLGQKLPRFSPSSLPLTSLHEPSIWARRPDEHWPSTFSISTAPISRTQNHMSDHTSRGAIDPSPIPTIPTECSGDVMVEKEQGPDSNRIIDDDDLKHISSFFDPEEDDERLGLIQVLEDDEDDDYVTASEYSDYESDAHSDDEAHSLSGSSGTSLAPALSPFLLPGMMKARPTWPLQLRWTEGTSGAEVLFMIAAERALKRGRI